MPDFIIIGDERIEFPKDCENDPAKKAAFLKKRLTPKSAEAPEEK